MVIGWLGTPGNICLVIALYTTTHYGSGLLLYEFNSTPLSFNFTDIFYFNKVLNEVDRFQASVLLLVYTDIVICTN